MNLTRVFFLMPLLAASWSHDQNTSQTTMPQQPEYVSIFQLIAMPEKFDGKRVVVTGYLELGSERDTLYFHEEDYKNGIFANVLGIDRTGDMAKNKQSLNLKYVTIVGLFRINRRLTALHEKGFITAIERCEFWSDPDHPYQQRIREIPGVSPR